MKEILTLLTQSRINRSNGYIKKEVTTLGIVTPFFYGWTISLPNNYKVKVLVAGRRISLKWEFLTPKQQWNFFRDKYFPEVIKFHCDWCIGVPELNSSGNMHFHLLCYDASFANVYDMLQLRKDLLQNKLVMSISHGNAKHSLHLNYVHYLDDQEEWIKYLEKDLLLHDHPCIKVKE